MKTKTIILIVVALALVWLVYNFLIKNKEEDKKTPVVAVNPPPKISNPNLPRPNIVPSVVAMPQTVIKTPSVQATRGWDFFDNGFFKGDAMFLGKTPHNFKLGQALFVAQKAPFTNSHYNGVARVTAIPTPTSVVINKPFGKNTPAESGVINLA